MRVGDRVRFYNAGWGKKVVGTIVGIGEKDGAAVCDIDVIDDGTLSPWWENQAGSDWPILHKWQYADECELVGLNNEQGDDLVLW